MTNFEDLKNVYKKAIADTTSVIKKMPYSIFLVMAFTLLYGIFYQLMFKIGMVETFMWGFLNPIINALVLSAIFYQLFSIVMYKRMDFRDFQKSFTAYALNVYSILFIFYIVELLSRSIIRTSIIFTLIYSLGVFIVFNTVAESIYLKGLYGLQALSYSLEYLKDNFYIWLPHVLIYILLKGIYNPFMIRSMYSNLDFFGCFFQPVKWFSPPLKYILALLFDGVYVIFRGILFRNTMDSTKRKRQFQGYF